MHTPWMKKDVERVPRDLGKTCREDAKKAQPQMKEMMEMRDLHQPYGCMRGWPDAPRARKIVFPALHATISLSYVMVREEKTDPFAY